MSTRWQEAGSLGLFIGHVLSVVCCLFVIITYLGIKSLRRHPQSIFFWMTVLNFMYAGISIFEFLNDEVDCQAVGPLAEFAFIGQELYLVMFAADLVESLKNPFSSGHSRIIAYHVFVWVTASSLAVALMVTKREKEFHGLCWTMENMHIQLEDWESDVSIDWQTSLLFVLPMALVYAASFSVYFWARHRLKMGLPTTYSTRLAAMQKLFKIVGGFTLYWTILVIMVIVEGLPSVHVPTIALFVNMMLGGKGLVHLIIWTHTQSLVRVLKQLKSGKSDEQQHQMESINWALRSEIMYFTTEGIRQSVVAASLEGEAKEGSGALKDPSSPAKLKRSHSAFEMNYSPRPHHRSSVPNIEDSLRAGERSAISNPLQTKPADGIKVSRIASRNDLIGGTNSHTQVRKREFKLSHEEGNIFYFHDYSPETFKHLRDLAAISTSSYLQSIGHTTQERFSEGKSGAFLYFTQDKRYIVKTCTHQEMRYLLRILPEYHKHLIKNPFSLINLITGAHSITMYGKTVYFTVIKTAFDTKLAIHDRYDLKGSWYGRYDKPRSIGTKVKCKYCSQKYKVGSSKDQICPLQRDGLKHAYDAVGKDLNWNKRVHLPVDLKGQLVEQLQADAKFLASIRSLDYSLLIGIHNKGFQVSQETEPQSPLQSPARSSSERDHRSASQSHQRPFSQSYYGGMGVDVVEGPGVYFMSIIDILKEWNFHAQMEHWLKVYILGQDMDGISCQQPKKYAQRFVDRVVLGIIEGREGVHIVDEHEATEQRNPLSLQSDRV